MSSIGADIILAGFVIWLLKLHYFLSEITICHPPSSSFSSVPVLASVALDPVVTVHLVLPPETLQILALENLCQSLWQSGTY